MITSYYTQRLSTRLIWFVCLSKRYQISETDEAYEAEVANYTAKSGMVPPWCAASSGNWLHWPANQGIGPFSQEGALNSLITTCIFRGAKAQHGLRHDCSPTEIDTGERYPRTQEKTFTDGTGGFTR